MGEKDRILIIGASGYLGRRMVRASIALGHPTFILFRPPNVKDVNKCQMFMEFKMAGARLIQGSLDDHESLVSALKQVDVVVSTVAGDRVLEQLKLIAAIKEAGTIKRYLPSEFGMDADRMEHAIPPGDLAYVEKRAVRRAVEEAGIPYTYVSANCLAGIYLAGLAQLATFMPRRDSVDVYRDGDRRCIWVAVEDVATYSVLAVEDARTVNKVLYVRPPANILTQMEVIRIWERLVGKELEKRFLSEEEWLSTMDKVSLWDKVAMAHMYQIFYRGDLDFEVEGPNGVDSSKLYPDQKYVTAEEYLRRFA